jgi:hypothetical protein
MKSNCPSCCKGCSFYHKADKSVCAIYHYGPVSETCGDFAHKVSRPAQVKLVKHRWNINPSELASSFLERPI